MTVNDKFWQSDVSTGPGHLVAGVRTNLGDGRHAKHFSPARAHRLLPRTINDFESSSKFNGRQIVDTGISIIVIQSKFRIKTI